MGITTIVWIVLFFTGSALTIYNPVFGVITYLFEYFTHPAFKWWGKGLPDIRWSLFISTLTFFSFILRWNKYKDHIKCHSGKIVLLIATLVYMVIVAAFLSMAKAKSFEYVITFAKLIVLVCVFASVIRTHEEFNWVIWALILGCFYFGVEAYIHPKMIGGRLENVGGVDTRESNFLSLLLVVPIPFLIIKVFHGKLYEKAIAIISAPFILNAIILCRSRGGLIALACMGAMLLYYFKKKERIKIAIGIGLAALMFLHLTDIRYVERMKTFIVRSEEIDQSAMSRLELWKTGLSILRENPLGIGGGSFTELSHDYLDESYQGLRVHNTYILVAVEWGIPAFVTFMSFIGSICFMLFRISRQGNSDENVKMYSSALFVSFASYLIGSFFVNRFYSDTLYWLVSMAMALYCIGLSKATNVKEIAGK